MKYLATVNGNSYPLLVEEEKGLFAVELNGERHTLDLRFTPGSSLHSVILDGRQYEVVIERGENGLSVYIGGEIHVVQLSEGLKVAAKKARRATVDVKAAMPGLVVAVEVESGQVVKRDDGLVILEAMKMQNEVRAPHSGIVTQIHVTAGSAVEKGERLVTLDTR